MNDQMSTIYYSLSLFGTMWLNIILVKCLEPYQTLVLVAPRLQSLHFRGRGRTDARMYLATDSLSNSVNSSSTVL